MTINGLLLSIFCLSCTEGEIIESNDCGVSLRELPELKSETEVELYATPLSDTWDTYVSINGEPVEITSLQRLGCGSCDTCRIEQQCDSCEECTECSALCDTSVCFEEMTILTPVLTENTAKLQIINKYGHSPVYDLTITE